MLARSEISLCMSTLRDQQLAWLDHITKSSGLTITEIARAAGLNPSTLTRFKAKNDSGHTLTSSTVRKIENATRVPAYESKLMPKMQQFSEEEAAPYIALEKPQGLVESALKSAATQAGNVDLWTLKTGSLAAVGYCSGMVVVIDRGAQPRNGDAVCAQKYDFRRGTAETVFRVFRTPYLLTAYMEGEPALPEIVDGENVAIMGVVVGGFRLRQ